MVQDEGHFITHYVAHQTAKGARHHPHDHDGDRIDPNLHGDTDARRHGNGQRAGVEPHQRAIAAFQQMRGEEHQQRGTGRQKNQLGAVDPEDRGAAQYHVAQRAAADPRQGGKEDETHRVQLSASGHQRAGQGENEDAGVIQHGDQGIERHQHLRRSGGSPGRFEGRHPPPRQLVRTLVLGMAGMPLDPLPMNRMARLRRVQPLPQVGILDRLLVGGSPAVPLPAVNPLRHAIFHIGAVGDDGDLADTRQGFQGADRRHQFHAVIGGIGLTAGKLALLDDLRAVHGAHQDPPAAGAGITAASAVSPGKKLRHARATASFRPSAANEAAKSRRSQRIAVSDASKALRPLAASAA